MVRRMSRSFAALLVAGTLLSGCGGDDAATEQASALATPQIERSTEAATAPTPAKAQSPKAPTSPKADKAPKGTITKATFTEEWPFTVDTARVRCRDAAAKGVGSVTVTLDGEEYAVNGTARGSGKWPDFAESDYWLADPSIQGAKVNIGPVIDIGLDLCRP